MWDANMPLTNTFDIHVTCQLAIASHQCEKHVSSQLAITKISDKHARCQLAIGNFNENTTENQSANLPSVICMLLRSVSFQRRLNAAYTHRIASWTSISSWALLFQCSLVNPVVHGFYHQPFAPSTYISTSSQLVLHSSTFCPTLFNLDPTITTTINTIYASNTTFHYPYLSFTAPNITGITYINTFSTITNLKYHSIYTIIFTSTINTITIYLPLHIQIYLTL